MTSEWATLLTCLLFCQSGHSIMVKFGTKDGPIEPPTTTEAPVPSKPYRDPAPVWEPREDDKPDPNANWRPQKFSPPGMYTNVYNPPVQNNAQRFVNAYLPKQPQQSQPVAEEPIINYFTPAQIVSGLSSQNLPGFGIRYFVPAFEGAPHVPGQQELKKQDDAKLNAIETNEVEDEIPSDQQWKAEKEAARRVSRNSQEGTYYHQPIRPYVYQWPIYVPRQQ